MCKTLLDRASMWVPEMLDNPRCREGPNWENGNAQCLMCMLREIVPFTILANFEKKMASSSLLLKLP